MTAADKAASRQCALPARTTPRNVRSVSPPFSVLYGRSLSHPWTAAGVRRRAINRRSFAVSGSAGGSTGSALGSGSRFEVGNEFGRRPHVAGFDGDETSVGINHCRAQVVHHHGAGIARLRGHTERL